MDDIQKVTTNDANDVVEETNYLKNINTKVDVDINSKVDDNSVKVAKGLCMAAAAGIAIWGISQI